MFALIQNGVCVSVNSVGFANAVMADNDYVIECDDCSASGKLHDKETGMFSDPEKSLADLAEEAQSYLNSTDWLEAKYVREVLREKSMTEGEFNLKYSVELDKREDAIELISDYEDSL